MPSSSPPSTPSGMQPFAGLQSLQPPTPRSTTDNDAKASSPLANGNATTVDQLKPATEPAGDPPASASPLHVLATPQPSPAPSPSPGSQRRLEELHNGSASTDSLNSALTGHDSISSNGADSNGVFVKANRFSKPVVTDPVELAIIAKRQWIYRVVDSQTSLHWHVDAVSAKQVRDLFVGSDQRPHLPANGAEPQARTSQRMAGQHFSRDDQISKTPVSVSTGYGELTQQSMDRVLKYMVEEAPEGFKLSKGDTFIDIGSGFGKAVFHAKVRSGCRKSIGIEYVDARHQKAKQCLAYLTARYCPGEAAPADITATDLDLSGVQLVCADATDSQQRERILHATHIYMFDWVFPEEAHKRLLPIIDQSACRIFVTYQKQRVERLKLARLQCIHSLQVKTTGKQSFTASIYVRQNADAIGRITRTIRDPAKHKNDIAGRYDDTQRRRTSASSRVQSVDAEPTPPPNKQKSAKGRRKSDSAVDAEPVQMPAKRKYARKSKQVVADCIEIEEQDDAESEPQPAKRVYRRKSQPSGFSDVVPADDHTDEQPSESTPQPSRAERAALSGEDLFIQRALAKLERQEKALQKRRQCKSGNGLQTAASEVHPAPRVEQPAATSTTAHVADTTAPLDLTAPVTPSNAAASPSQPDTTEPTPALSREELYMQRALAKIERREKALEKRRQSKAANEVHPGFHVEALIANPPLDQLADTPSTLSPSVALTQPTTEIPSTTDAAEAA